MGASGCGRVVIVIVNIVFLILGLIFFVAGLIAKFGTSMFESYYKPVLDSLESSLENQGYGNVSFDDFNLADLIGGVALFLIFLGLFLIIITVLGCCGACCKVKVMLIIYAVIIILLLVGEVIFIGILYGKPDLIKDDIKKPLKSGIQSDYAGFNGTNVASLAWNFIHREFKCCGVDNYNDFTGATQWRTDYGAGGTLKIPITCCKEIPDSSNMACATTPVDYFTDGCFDIIYDMMLGNMTLVLGVCGGCAAFQMKLIAFALMIVKEKGDEKEDDAEKAPEKPKKTKIEPINF